MVYQSNSECTLPLLLQVNWWSTLEDRNANNTRKMTKLQWRVVFNNMFTDIFFIYDEGKYYEKAASQALL